MKKSKINKTSHTSNSKLGMGDFTGVGSKNKVGKIIRLHPVDYAPMSSKKLGKAPQSLA